MKCNCEAENDKSEPPGRSATCERALRSLRNAAEDIPYKPMRAGDGTRTHDSHLGKVALYQLSYTRKRFVLAAINSCGQRTYAHDSGKRPSDRQALEIVGKIGSTPEIYLLEMTL
jgi:hypothetical protein